MQTDDTLILGDSAFVELESTELEKARLMAKPTESLARDTPLIFNGCKLVIDRGGPDITILQKGQGKRLNLVNPKLDGFKQANLEQRARGAYIGTICQPEAAFDMSTAAQHQNPAKEQIAALNKRLQWQKTNFLIEGLHFCSLDLSSAKLFVFVDGSFAMNKDLSSQIGYVAVLGNEEEVMENLV